MKNHYIIVYPQSMAAHPRTTSTHRQIFLDLSEEFIAGLLLQRSETSIWRFLIPAHRGLMHVKPCPACLRLTTNEEGLKARLSLP